MSNNQRSVVVAVAYVSSTQVAQHSSSCIPHQRQQ